MLSTERPSSRTGRAPAPCASRTPPAPRASCRVLLASRVARTSCLVLGLALRTAEVCGPWATSASWHRALHSHRAPRQRASIGRQQIDERTLQPLVHAFHMYIAYVLFVRCKSRSGVAYVAMSVRVCCKYMFQMF
jgi:hypothetical protein